MGKVAHRDRLHLQTVTQRRVFGYAADTVVIDHDGRGILLRCTMRAAGKQEDDSGREKSAGDKCGRAEKHGNSLGRTNAPTAPTGKVSVVGMRKGRPVRGGIVTVRRVRRNGGQYDGWLERGLGSGSKVVVLLE
ncbi:hypothetical protein GCM10009552_33390 [Rothia nasimurium]